MAICFLSFLNICLGWMMNLFEITGQFLQLQEMLEDGEYDEKIFEDTLESLNFDFEEKADNYAKIIRNFESQIEALKAEERRLKDRRQVCEKAIKRLKDNLQAAMMQTGKRKIKTDLFSFTVAKNGGALPVIVDVDTEDLPDECVVITEKPDLKALAALLTDPENKEYYKKFAHFGERGESLRIK